MNPSIVELTTMFENVSIYNIQDSNRAILFDSSCPEKTCTSVLEYKNKLVNPQLAGNKKPSKGFYLFNIEAITAFPYISTTMCF